MSDKKIKQPKVRFKEFAGENAYPWEQRKLGDHAEILTGGTPKTSIREYWEPKQIPWMSSGEVNKRRLNETDNMISEEGFANSSARWVKEHSVLIALAGQGKTRGTVAINNIPLTTNQSIAAIVPDENLYYEFIYQNLIRRYDELRMISSGDGTRGGLNKQIVSDVMMPYTSYEEQAKIGDFFKNIDNLITLHQRELENTKNLKNTMLSKMFPKEGSDIPDFRFAGFTDPWEQRKLGDIYSKIRNAFVGTASPYYVGEGNFYLESNNVKNGQINRNTEVFINDEFYMKQKDNWLHTGDMVMVQSGHVGHAAVIPPELNNTAAHALIIFSEPKVEMNPYFLNYQYQTSIFTKGIDNIATGNTIKHILSSEMKRFVVSSTCIEEQNKIGDFFIQIDNIITLHQRQLENYQNLKKTMLEKMFI